MELRKSRFSVNANSAKILDFYEASLGQ